MIPPENDLLDATAALSKISKALGLEHVYPVTPAGWMALAAEVERRLGPPPLTGVPLQEKLIAEGVILCPPCKGKGHVFDSDDEEYILCNRCHGSGRRP